MISIYDRIINFIRSRTLAFWVVVGIILAVVLFVFHFLTTYSIAVVAIKYNDGIKEPATVFSIAEGREDKKISALINDLFLISRDTVALRASTDNYSTIKELVNIPPQETITINLYKDKNATKYSGDSPGCMTYDNTSDRLLSYSCTRPRELVEYRQQNNSAPPQNNSVATIASLDTAAYSVKPYQGGVLGIRMPRFDANVPTSNFLFKIDSNGKVTEASIPDSLDQTQLGATNVITDTTSSSQSSFLLVAKQSGKVYFSEKVTAGAMSYKEYSLPDDFSPVFDTLLCNLVQSTAYCFYGYSSGPPDSEKETKHHEEEKPATFITVDFASETPIVNQYATKTPTPIDSLFVTRAGKIYALSGEDLVRVEVSDKTALPYTYIPDVGSISTGDGLYFIRNNSIYRFDDKNNESYLIFHSPKLRLSSVINLNENIFLNAYIDGAGGERVHTYRINDEPNNNPGFRLIDTLPLSFSESPDISDMDLYKNNLHIRVKVAVNKTGKGGIDISQYNAAKQRIIDLLQEKSIDTSGLNITFSY